MVGLEGTLKFIWNNSSCLNFLCNILVKSHKALYERLPEEMQASGAARKDKSARKPFLRLSCSQFPGGIYAWVLDVELLVTEMCSFPFRTLHLEGCSVLLEVSLPMLGREVVCVVIGPHGEQRLVRGLLRIRQSLFSSPSLFPSCIGVACYVQDIRNQRMLGNLLSCLVTGS